MHPTRGHKNFVKGKGVVKITMLDGAIKQAYDVFTFIV